MVKNGRQKNGTGTFRTHKRKDGSEYVEYRVYLGIGADGKPWRPSFYGDTNKEALKSYKDWLKNSGNVPIEKVTTVGTWADKWLDIYKKNGAKKIAYKSYKNYELYVNKHIKPFFGKLKFEQVRQAHIESFFGGLPKDMSYSARHHIYITLKAIFTTAVTNRLCEINPFGDFKLEKPVKRKPKAFPIDDISKILAFIPQDRDGLILGGLLHTGVREGELSAFEWPDLHLDESYIEVNRTVAEVEAEDKSTYKIGGKEKHHKQYAIKDIPKSNKERKVVLTPQGVEFFKTLPRTALFMFPSLSASFMTPNQFRYRYDHFFKKLNEHLDEEQKEYLQAHPGAKSEELVPFEHVAYLSPHKCRHTYARRLLAATSDLKTVQEQLGHQQVSTTEIYLDDEIEVRKSNVTKLKY